MNAPATTAPTQMGFALKCFELRCWARAYLYMHGLMTLHEAVDGLQASAERCGLVGAIGQDAVQRMIVAPLPEPEARL